MTELFVICETMEVQEEEVRGFVLARQIDGRMEPWPILITRKGGTFHAYENACPHDGARLDTGTGEFLDDEGNFLKCSVHGDLFDLDDGKCFIGPGKGGHLKRIDIIIDDGDICMIDDTLTEEDGLHLSEPDEHPEVMITSD
ncbi:Rieske (2Fe-2S) protein [Novosphingobium mangrovi (ex Huang et al. 2023)]|uniref:Rieske 2Fe-2S domain-containing protein n=1 Tax=Novosphingobium mangrovi (ex Huang et al. 2023) TaxID=2976432 RepID=A0ABT2I268_9SPHN|nr:Rieske 2Fe-2S domain-containing protein [Novosphingobium mangrovi (ex Huang et al. 2023)]MCT2398901.1 Rieske 2Fe-2S domain-containing protein [Novosphingobium mangrovi (ex Huang et al. 2023)]